MLNLILIFVFVVKITVCWLPSEKCVEYDNAIMDIIKNDSLTDGTKLLDTVRLFIFTIKNTTQLLNTNDDMLDEFKNLYAQGWADFLLHEFDDANIKKLEKKFKWNNELVTEFKTLLDEAEDAYKEYVIQFHKFLEKEYPTTNSSC